MAAATAAFGLAAWAAAAAAGVEVQVESLDVEPAGGQAVRLPATWFAAPQSADATRAPALVALHGCGGRLDARGQLAARYRELASRLNALGIHVLVTDSFTPRGFRQICTLPPGAPRVTQVERRRDALGALAWLAAQPGVDAGRIGLLGWSNGGSTVLAATNLRHPEVLRAALLPTLAIAYYPGCAFELQRGYRAAAPLLMLLGEADDWTPARDCQALAARAERAAATPAPQVQVYPGAHHGFDGATPVRHWREVQTGVNPGLGVHVGGQPEARAASQAQLELFLQQTWKLAPVPLSPPVPTNAQRTAGETSPP